jgi:hypothetical protein
MPDYSRFVPNVHFELIPIKTWFPIRSTNAPLLGPCEKRGEHFDLYRLTREGKLPRGANYVFNGQHT